MAKFNLSNYTEKDGLGFPLNFRRGNPNPLDNSSIWSSLEAAQNYAISNPTAYVGQELSVVTYSSYETDGITPTADATTTVTVYVIENEKGDLKEVGKTFDDSEIQAQLKTLNTAVEDLDKKIDKTHESVKDMSNVDGGDRYEISYKNNNLNIRSNNTLDLTITTGIENFKETTTTYPYTEGTTKIEVISRTDGNMQGIYVSKTPAVLSGQVSYPYHWRGVTNSYYLKLDNNTNNISAVVSGIVDISAPIEECIKNADGTYTYGDTTNITSNLPTGYVGSHLVSFEKCTAGETDADGAFNYLKATVLGDFDNNNYNGTVFYFVEPKNYSRAKNGSNKTPVPPDATVYPITLDITTKDAIWSPTYCHNYQHQFVMFATKVADSEELDKIYLISAGTRVDGHTTEPAPVIANKFKFGGSSYILDTLSKKAIKVLVQNDSEINETFDLIDNLKGHGKLMCNAPVLAYPAVNTGKFFGVSPALSWVSEADLGAFSYYYSQKLNYVPETQQYQINRVNPVGDYQIIKIEGQGIAYLDSGDIMVVPDAMFHGVKRTIHPELPELASDAVPEEEVIQYMTISSWIQDSSLEDLETRKDNNDWQTGRLRHFYRTLRIKRNVGKVVTEEDGTQHGGVANWSAFHEIVTSENISDYFTNTDYTLELSEDNTQLIFKKGSETVNTISLPTVSTENSVTYDLATSDTAGLIKTGYEQNGKNYAVKTDEEGNAYVNVPWSDTNTTYTEATETSTGLMSAEDKSKLAKGLNADGQVQNLKSAYLTMNLTGLSPSAAVSISNVTGHMSFLYLGYDNIIGQSVTVDTFIELISLGSLIPLNGVINYTFSGYTYHRIINRLTVTETGAIDFYGDTYIVDSDNTMKLAVSDDTSGAFVIPGAVTFGTSYGSVIKGSLNN